MKQLPAFPDDYWQKFSEEPVTILPFDPRSPSVAKKYLLKLNSILNNFPTITLYHRGSTSLGIAGKTEIEVGVLPGEDNWYQVIVYLSQQYKGLGNLDDEYCRFNDHFEGFQIEIILLRGYSAKLDLALHEYMSNNQQVLKEYEQLKHNSCHSKRVYYQNKDQFFRKVIERIPDN